MNPANQSLNIQRVNNGWVITAWNMAYRIDGGYLPEGSFVAATPDELARLLAKWASDQEAKA